jgi:hypothetical protein
MSSDMTSGNQMMSEKYYYVQFSSEYFLSNLFKIIMLKWKIDIFAK